MAPSDYRHRLVLVATALLVILGPVLIIFATLGTLVIFGDLVFSQLTPLEFLELYIVDLVLFVGLIYGIYRLTSWLMEDQLPASLTKLDASDAEDAPDDGSEPNGDR